ncbi:MAG: MoaD/ThiS family protein [Promethearchaeota archaeon]
MTDKNKITATIKFFANLRDLAPPKKIVILPTGSTVSTVLDMFAIAIETKLIILINGSPHKTRETYIKDGDIVAIFPPLAGG